MPESRTFDCCFDSTYQTSDWGRAASLVKAKGGTAFLQPVYCNLFSELPHHPSRAVRYHQTAGVPACCARPLDLGSKHDQDATQAKVTGTDRALYNFAWTGGASEQGLTALHLDPGALLTVMGDSKKDGPQAGAPQAAVEPAAAALPAHSTHSVGVQSAFRDSEGQTAPWEAAPAPGPASGPSPHQAALSRKQHCAGAEIAELRHMLWAGADPAAPGVGPAEVAQVEHARLKRAFEAALPPLDDVQRLPLRQELLEAWEVATWDARLETLAQSQALALGRLGEALRQREAEADAAEAARVASTLEARRRRTHEAALTALRRHHADLRHLAMKRKGGGRRGGKRGLIEEYADFGSRLYVPLLRDGPFIPKYLPEAEDLQPEHFEAAHVANIGPHHLERFLARGPASPRRKAAEALSQPLRGRGVKDQAYAAHLQHLSSVLAAMAEGGPPCPSAFPFLLGVEEGQDAPKEGVSPWGASMLRQHTPQQSSGSEEAEEGGDGGQATPGPATPTRGSGGQKTLEAKILAGRRPRSHEGRRSGSAGSAGRPPLPPSARRRRSTAGSAGAARGASRPATADSQHATTTNELITVAIINSQASSRLSLHTPSASLAQQTSYLEAWQKPLASSEEAARLSWAAAAADAPAPLPEGGDQAAQGPGRSAQLALEGLADDQHAAQPAAAAAEPTTSMPEAEAAGAPLSPEEGGSTLAGKTAEADAQQQQQQQQQQARQFLTPKGWDKPLGGAGPTHPEEDPAGSGRIKSYWGPSGDPSGDPPGARAEGAEGASSAGAQQQGGQEQGPPRLSHSAGSASAALGETSFVAVQAADRLISVVGDDAVLGEGPRARRGSLVELPPPPKARPIREAPFASEEVFTRAKVPPQAFLEVQMTTSVRQE